MKELKDKDFDELFRSRITEEMPAFEEESWLKMEEKLRKKDRLVFYRYASVILLLLSFGLAFYFINKDATTTKQEIATKDVKKTKSRADSIKQPERSTPALTDPQSNNLVIRIDRQQQKSIHESAKPQKDIFTPPASQDVKNNAQLIPEANVTPIPNNAANLNPLSPVQTKANQSPQTAAIQQTPLTVPTEEPVKKEKQLKTKRRIPISLAINIGPDFNSTSSVVGGKTSLAFGIGVGIGITKKLSVQTGVNYGHKNYNASAYDYAFNNANAVNTVSQVQAACKVLEIPFRASLNISENKQRRIELNAGLSSYLMLKEDYTFKYHPTLNRADRLAQVTNENKHILSVIDLSASYDVKLKNKNLALGIEPYVKIPLTGIGEGNVPLKSSGISLKLRYDFNKRP